MDNNELYTGTVKVYTKVSGMTNAGGCLGIDYSDISEYETILSYENGIYTDLKHPKYEMNVEQGYPVIKTPIVSNNRNLYMIEEDTLKPYYGEQIEKPKTRSLIPSFFKNR